jgi:hypothetical protein
VGLHQLLCAAQNWLCGGFVTLLLEDCKREVVFYLESSLP